MSLTPSNIDTVPNNAPSPDELPQTSVLVVFIGLLVAMTVGALDQTIVATALPTIVGELGGVNHLLWVVTAYVLAATITMPIYGKMGDLIGRKGLFIGALVLFIVGSVVCGLSTSMGGLIVGRAVQGLGGGGLMILSQAIVADIVPPRKRAMYLSAMGIAYAVPMLAGPLLGGLFTDTIGWRWAFWINVPLALVAIGTAVAFLPKPRRTVEKAHFDTWGTVTLVVAVTALTLATSWGGVEYAWDSPVIVALLATVVVAGVLFAVAERHAKEPLMALSLFKNRNFNICTVAGFVTTFVMMGVLTYLPTYLQIVDGMSATAAGYMEVPMNVAWFAASLASGYAVSKLGTYKKLMVASFGILVVGVGALTFITSGTPVAFIGALLAIVGFGIGLNFEILVLIVQNEFAASDVGMATAATNFFREVGTTLGTSIVGALFTSGLARTLTENLASVGGTDALGVDANSLTPAIVHALPQAVRDAVGVAYNDALVPVFWFMLPLALIGLALLLFLRETPLATTVEDSGRMS
ncbi:MDR family MFS transporter [Eggerthella sinensis]|uniref:MDR family MFS transporter n=1 Tax=Eggerthella sinensis TaxID=242230 RepID=UPI0022E1FA6E|nr:MDR family MFS transporter [Eggerthella sinensis]